MENKNITAARRIAEKVSSLGGKVYYVGGFVRDGIMGRECKDVDIEVHGISTDALISVLESEWKPKAMGQSFGIFGLSGYELDISVPRKENVPRGGKDIFTECADPFIGEEAAAKRRDFTVNALMQNVLTDEILDFYGGTDDIKSRIIRHVDKNTFADDPLRVIRAAQFSSRFGFEIAKETMELCRIQDISAIASERVYEELKKVLLGSEKPSLFFETLRSMDKLDDRFCEIKALIGVQQPPAFHPEGDVWNHTMAVLDIGATLRDRAENPLGFMLSLLCHDLGKPLTTTVCDGRIRSIGHELEGMDVAKSFIRRLTSDNGILAYTLNMTKLHMRPNMIAEQGASDKAFCKVFDASVSPQDLLLVSEADFCGCGNHVPYGEKREYLQKKLDMFKKRMSMPYVTGKDLIKAGYVPGETLGEALDYAHKLRLAGVPKNGALYQTLSYYKKSQKG